MAMNKVPGHNIYIGGWVLQPNLFTALGLSAEVFQHILAQE